MKRLNCLTSWRWTTIARHDHQQQFAPLLPQLLIMRRYCANLVEQQQEQQQQQSVPATSNHLSLLQRYTLPGTPKKHPLDVLRQVAQEALATTSSETTSGSDGDISKTKWSLEELQIITADAARRAAKTSRLVLDDDLDPGASSVTITDFTQDDDAGSSSQSDETQRRLALEASLGLSFVEASSEAAVGDFAAEQKQFDDLHSLLFGGSSETSEALLVQWVERWIARNNKSSSVTKNDSDLACVVSIIHRMILLASVFRRVDAAVESFMLLLNIKGECGVDTVRDTRQGAGTIDVEVLSFRQLRDVLQACSAATSSSGATVSTSSSQLSHYDTAETLLRLVLTKYSNSTSSIQDIVNTPVLAALAGCIRTSADLQRFRELMAVECSPPSGALAHIPVSTPLYTELIFACARCNDDKNRAQLAMSLFRTIGDNGLVPTAKTFAGMVAVHAAEGSCTEAFAMFHEAKSKCDPRDVAACPPLYNKLIEGYCNAGKLHDAIATTNVLIEAQAPLTRRGFHAALMACAVQGDLSQCRDFMATMQGKPLPTNDVDAAALERQQPSYRIPATPTTIGIALASLFFIRRGEFDWREKMTVIGDFTGDAFALDANSVAMEAKKQEEERVSVFSETEGFFCAVLSRVLATTTCPPLFSKLVLSSSAELKLYRRHLNLPIRIVQTHCQFTLCGLLERAVERFAEAEKKQEEQQQDSFSNTRRRFLRRRLQRYEALLDRARAGQLFAPQSPAHMPRNAEVAALLPDVVLNPALLDDDAEMRFNNENDNDVVEASSSADSLLHLLQSVLPHATIFFVPFATIRAIVTEADTLLRMNDFPLFQRELFGDCLSPLESLSGATLETRKIAARTSSSGSSNSNSGNKSMNRNAIEEQMALTEAAVQRDAILTDGGTISVNERERRLNRLSNAVLALAVFLDHHGEAVHIESLTSDVDGSRACPALHLDFASPVQRAAASSVAMVVSGTSLIGVRGASDMHRTLETARSHEYHMMNGNTANDASNRRRKQRGVSNSINSSRSFSPQLAELVDFVATQPQLRNVFFLRPQPQQQEQEADPNEADSSVPALVDDETQLLLLSAPSLLYLRAEANLSLVTCDATLNRMWRPKQHNNQNPKITFRDCVDSLCRFARAVAGALNGNSRNSSNNDASSQRNDALRNVSGVVLKSLQPPQQTIQQQRQRETPPPPPGFRVRLFDPRQEKR